MLAMLHEAGWVAWLVVAIAAAGSAVVRSRRLRAPAVGVAAWFAALAMAIALANASVCQHKVDAAVQREADAPRQVLLLSEGTREASANLFVGATCAAIVLLVGAVASIRQRKLAAAARPAGVAV